MSTTHNKTHATPKRHWEAFLRTTRALLIGLAGGLLLVVPASAQYGEAANTQTGTILGTVVDISSDPIPDAKIVLQGPAGNPVTAVTKDDGSFALHDVTPGIAYQIAVTADGFADWSSPVTVEPGQQKTLTDVRLRILAVQPAVTVSYSSKEVAAQQLKAEEHQRVLGFIPNIYRNLRTSSRTSYCEDEVSLGLQRPYPPNFFCLRGFMGRRPTGHSYDRLSPRRTRIWRAIRR